jgi:glyoxylase-like metal-dependent hydrolase (beta-lactamase superfamily II)
MKITPNVHLIPGVIANSYLILETTGLTLIDAGLPGSHRKILRFLTQLGYAPKGLKRIIITHADIDHVGGLAGVETATGARIFANAIEASAVAKGASSRPLKASNSLARFFYGLMERLVKTAPVRADEYLVEGHVLPVLGGLHVLETPGHTPGHISLYAPSVGILFCGDSIVAENNRLRGSRGSNTWDQDKADESVLKQAALGARIVCSGHGPVVMDAAGKFPLV